LALRILFLVRDLSTGTQTYTESIIRLLTANGVDVVLTYTGERPQGMPQGPISLNHRMLESIDSSFVAQPLRLLPVLMSMLECVVAFNPHLIFAQGLDENGFTAVFASLIFRRPAISFVHDLTIEELTLKNPRCASILSAMSLLRQRITARRLSKVMVGSNFMRYSLLHTLGVSAVITRLGVREELLGYKASPPETPFQVIFVGNFITKKRPEIAIQMLAALKDLDLKLVLVGDGPERESLVKLSDKLDVSHKLEFKGRLSSEDLRKELQRSHVCVVPSIWEGFGLGAPEAMAQGVPVIASDSGALPEIVKEGKTGFLIPLNSDVMWASTVRRLYQDRALLRRLSAESFEALKTYGWGHTCNETLKVIETLERKK
jgi:glycosyltransferase involved in cell wall biosynthesis